MHFVLAEFLFLNYLFSSLSLPWLSWAAVFIYICVADSSPRVVNGLPLDFALSTPLAGSWGELLLYLWEL